LAADADVPSWFAPDLLTTYRRVTDHEIEQAGLRPSESLCRRYSAVY
jgi:hypothetical protein